MVKTVLTAVLLLAGCMSFAGDLSLEVGLMPDSNSVNWNSDAETNWLYAYNIFYLDFNVTLDLPLNMFVGGSTTTYMLANSRDPTFYPFFTDYTFTAGWEYKAFTIGYEHMCAHSIYTLGYYVEEPIYSADRGYDKIFLKYHTDF